MKKAYLNKAPPAEPGLDEALGHPSGGVGGRAVDLGVVLAAEGAAAVRAPPAVRVDDDLAAGEAGVAHRTADDEVPARVDVVLGILVQVPFAE